MRTGFVRPRLGSIMPSDWIRTDNHADLYNQNTGSWSTTVAAGEITVALQAKEVLQNGTAIDGGISWS